MSVIPIGLGTMRHTESPLGGASVWKNAANPCETIGIGGEEEIYAAKEREGKSVNARSGVSVMREDSFLYTYSVLQNCP